MRKWPLAFAFGPLMMWTAEAGAAAPPQLYNKSIMITWGEGRTMKSTEGHTRHRVVHAEYGIYISSAGRAFSQMGRSVVNRRGKIRNSSGSSVGPDGSTIKTSNARYGRQLSFQGRSIHTDVKYESGARRITVNFDEGFRSCSVNIIHGKEEGAPGIVQYGMNTRLHMLTSVSVSSPTCSIRDGNIFGE